MNEQLPIDMGFAPWSRNRGSADALSPAAMQAVNAAAGSEIEQDFIAQCCLDSMYFSGKGLAKCKLRELIPLVLADGISCHDDICSP
jgi:endo-1,3(4)-beta-glucanase